MCTLKVISNIWRFWVANTPCSLVYWKIIKKNTEVNTQLNLTILDPLEDFPISWSAAPGGDHTNSVWGLPSHYILARICSPAFSWFLDILGKMEPQSCFDYNFPAELFRCLFATFLIRPFIFLDLCLLRCSIWQWFPPTLLAFSSYCLLFCAGAF